MIREASESSQSAEKNSTTSIEKASLLKSQKLEERKTTWQRANWMETKNN